MKINSLSRDQTPVYKVIIIGGGIIGALESYYAYLDALQIGKKICVQIYEKGPCFTKKNLTNTAYNIFPSLTADEILAVVPRGAELMEKLSILFSEPGGIRVNDVPGVNDSPNAVLFTKAAELYGQDKNHDDRTRHLLRLGKLSMDLWQTLYEHGDRELQYILEESNFHPCHNPKQLDKRVLHDGYRIDLIYGITDAQKRAHTMQSTYTQLGYHASKILSPTEVINIDPSLTNFCLEHAEQDSFGRWYWKPDSCALWRPGGCINTQVFLPRFYTYLKKIMGTHLDASGATYDCFSLECNKEVTGVQLDQNLNIIGLEFQDGTTSQKSLFTSTQYVFCPGESIGTLHKLGFDEPIYAGFAGPSLTLSIPLPTEKSSLYRHFNHYMEVHKVGIVLSWQARYKNDQILIGVAGTKAFYGDQQPHIDQEFAKHRHLTQLNMINDVLPDIISIACGYNTKGMSLAAHDLATLENKGILQRWVGKRAVAYDGFPTLGALYYKGQKVSNARCTTHLGSGGVSFAPAAIHISQQFAHPQDAFVKTILQYADSRRSPISLLVT